MVLQFNKIMTFIKLLEGARLRLTGFCCCLLLLGRINMSELENNLYMFSLLGELRIFTGSLIKLTKGNVLLYISYETFQRLVVSGIDTVYWK